jgi:4-amino-4-deoxy-L-arabinose transferase-like glycosyltransferase
VGARTIGRGAALLAAAVTTLSPFMIFYSAEARGYAVLMALVLASTLSMLIAIERRGTGWWVLYGAAVCLAAYTHYTAVYVLAVQLAWALWTQPRSRTPLLVATGSAALVFAPWFPSLKGDLDSPTAVILGALSPVDGDSMRLALGQWSVGFPAANFGVPLPFDVSGSSLRDLPGAPALVLLAASACVGAVGAFTMRTRLRGWFADRGGRLTLLLLLAVASPIGAAVQSAVGTNVFRTRTFAASWPYLALAAAALVTIGRPALRVTAAALAVTAFAVATITMLGDDFHRPGYRTAARQGDAQQGGVIVNGAAYTPGPLTDFEVEGAVPDSPVFRVNVPEQMETPFTLTERRPDPADVAERAVAAADGGPITLVSFIPELPVVTQLVNHLPPDYELTDTTVIPGILDLEVRVYEREGPTAGS